MKRLTAALLCIVMLAAAFPGEALAAETDIQKNESLTDQISREYESIGIGGGGAFFLPLIDPTDSSNIYSACDMGGLYYSHDAGSTWGRTETAGRLKAACIADDGTIFTGGYGLYKSCDEGQSLQMIYPKNVVYEIGRCGWNENLMFAPGFDNGYLKCVDTTDEYVYFVTVDWTGILRLMRTDYNGSGFELLYTEQTEHTNPMGFAMQMVVDGSKIYLAEDRVVRCFGLTEQEMSTVYEAAGTIRDLEKIGPYWFILDDGSSQTQILYTEDFNTYQDLMDFNTLDPNFNQWGTDYTIEWHFDGICGNNFQSIFLSMSCEDADGILKFNGQEFQWIYDSVRYTREATTPGGWSYGCYGPFYGISSDPSNDDRCIVSTIETVYLMELDDEGSRSIQSLSSDGYADGTYSTRGLNVQTTYGVHEDPFDEQHLIIPTTDMGMQISYNGGESWRRMEITGTNYDIYNTCYDLYMDRSTKDLVYGIWSNRHDAPYSPTQSDTGWTQGKFGVSTDGGITWDLSYSTGLPEDCIPVRMSVQENGDALTIAVSTFNRGFYISYDSGKTFSSINSGMNTENGLIWGEDVILTGDTVYCLTAPYTRDNDMVSAELYIYDLNSKTTTQADLGELVWVNSITWREGQGLYINALPSYHYEWMAEYNDGFWKNDNGGIYLYEDSGLTQIFSCDSGVISSTFAPDGTMYAVDAHSRLYKGADGEFTVMADDLFYMLKRVNVSPDGDTLYVSTHGGGTYKFAIQEEDYEANTDTSMYCWNLYLLNEGSSPDTLGFLESLNTARVYQDIPTEYLVREETADMVTRLTERGIEVVALTGDRSWGLKDNDLTEIKTYIDTLSQYNETIGQAAPVTKLALDVETYTYSSWKNDPVTGFTAYIEQMQQIYNYAKEHGISVVQVIPVHFDKIDPELFALFLETCADELSLMNYNKATQVTAIADEVELCRSLGMPVETIFETMPNNDYYSVTEDLTYFYDGFDALCEKRDEILDTYRYDGLTAGYHHFPTMFHVVTGAYLAEIYAYTDSADPTRNELGQTEALRSIVLTGDDGSVITAGLYNPNRGYEYEENCYLAAGIREGVTYTVTAGSPDYEIVNPTTKTFELEEDELVHYSSLRIRAVEAETQTFTVTFLDHDGTVLDTQEAVSGAAAAAPADPDRAPDGDCHYVFAGWDVPFDKVDEDLTVTAVYEASAHTAELVNAREATCTEEGYTGAYICTICGMVVQAGSSIAKLDHSWETADNGNGTHSPCCTVCGIAGTASACADNDGDGLCDSCGSTVDTTALPDSLVKKNTMDSGKAYLILSGNYALGKSLDGTKITMRSSQGKYVPSVDLREELLWYYDNGRIYCEVDGTKYYLGCDSRTLFVSDDVSDAAGWSCSGGRIYTKTRFLWTQQTLYLTVSGSRFTLSALKKSITLYEAG